VILVLVIFVVQIDESCCQFRLESGQAPHNGAGPSPPAKTRFSQREDLIRQLPDEIFALLDPYVGFYHQPRFGRPALALDVMEEFRALIVESTVLTLLNNRMLGLNDFIQAGQAVNLTS
jgi:hypothetical protein